MLSLYDQLLLLSIHEDKGTIIQSTVEQLRPGLVGAILAELAIMGKIQTRGNHRLSVVDDSPTEVDDLNEALAAIKASEKERRFGYWIETLNQKPEKFRKQIMERLIQQGVVTQEDDHLVWIVPTPYQTDLNASSKYWMSRRLRDIVLARGEYTPRDLALLTLIRACDLLDLIFLKDERRFASRNINEMVVSMAIKDPVFQTIQEIESAIAVIAEDD